MRFIIPDHEDLRAVDGDLVCFQIQWPDTAFWRSVLIGLLFELTRGRNWDERTGRVKDAQAAGYKLFELNYPLAACPECLGGGDEGNIPPDACQHGNSGGGGWGAYHMWAVTDVTIEAGKLVLHYGPCCTKVVEGSLTATGTPSDLDNGLEGRVDPVTGEPLAPRGCAKASAVIGLLWDLAQVISGDGVGPHNVVQTVRAAYPSISFNVTYLVGAYLDWVKTTLLDAADPLELVFPGGATERIWSRDALLDERRRQAWVCRAAPLYADDLTRPSEDIISKTIQLSTAVYPYGAGTFWWGLARAVGYGDLRDVAVAGALDLSAVCDCPELHPQVVDPLRIKPAGTTWAYLLDLRLDLWGFGLSDGATWTTGVGALTTTAVGNDRRLVRLDMVRPAEGDDDTVITHVGLRQANPTGIVEWRYPDVVSVGGWGSWAAEATLPPPTVVQQTLEAPIAWPYGSTLSIYPSSFYRGSGQPPTGAHVLMQVWLAGTGQAPIPSWESALIT